MLSTKAAALVAMLSIGLCSPNVDLGVDADNHWPSHFQMERDAPLEVARATFGSLVASFRN